MKAFVLGIVLIAVIAVGANIALENIGFSQANISISSDKVRLGDAASDRE
ncbi:hypothetical protein P775_24040 [Puniceibacterium antarcticum]|uniref:Uncharacterized protein n=1 Tax=Puniceibacterium antarcticum TaxID=1206336 RepID=A0A2G8R880_9RHOB|nr:hypothetical protein [Puniceibacterium antarcticum]PIL17651.1 hypothetical protein P775_24040 [Puniceibacterium antarcticum]